MMNVGVMFAAKRAPRIPIILSHEHLEWQKLIKGIMNTVNLPDNQAEVYQFETEFSTTWHLQNKYYSAYVLLMVIHEHRLSNTLSSMKTSDVPKTLVEGVIIYWDNKYNDSRQKLDTILTSLGDEKPEVCLLVCDDFKQNAQVSRYEATQWCIEHGWELIELEPEPSDDLGTLDGDFVDYGIQRMQSALHANRWSNMKEVAGGVPLDTRAALIRCDEDPFVGHCSPSDGSDEEQEELHNNDESFEELFARFGEMRITAASLSRNDRLDYAERIATAFLGAMGGDEDEEADTEEENTPDAEDGDPFHGYSELINSLDHVKLDSEAAPQVDESSDCDISSSEGLSNDHFTQEIGSTERLTELGFPVVDPETSGEGSHGSDHGGSSRQETDADAADTSCTLNAQEDEFPVRSYEDIEEELKQEELEARLRKAAATEEIHNELHDNLAHSKKFRI